MHMKMFNRWVKKDDGTTAIEFSLLALPFMLSSIALIELALFFVSGSLLEGAVADASRTIRTGQLQANADPLTVFLDELCDHAGVFLDCDNFQYQVQKLDDFDDDLTPQIDADGNITPPDLFELDQITAGCMAMVRITYRFQFITPFFGDMWSNYSGNRRLQMATVVFQAEPYDFDVTDPTCSV